MPDDMESRVAALESVTTDLAGLVRESREKLGVNETHIVALAGKFDESSTSILAALARLQNAQDVHMARSDEKFSGVAVSLTSVIDKLDKTADRLSANESLSQQLRTQSADQFKQLRKVEAAAASMQTTLTSQGTPEHAGSNSSLLNSPNLKYIMAPIIIILLGLFALAGVNMTGDAKKILGVAEVSHGD